MDGELARRQIARAAAHEPLIGRPAHGHHHPGPEAVGGQQGVGAGVQRDAKPVAGVERVVAVVGQLPRVGGHEDIQVAVVVGVEVDERAALAGVIETGVVGDLGEHRATLVVKELAPFVDPLAAGGGPAVDLENIQPRVVIEVHRNGPPSPAPVVHPGGDGALDEQVIALAHVQHVAGVVRGRRLAVNRRDVPVEPPVVVEVSDGLTHAVVVEPGPRAPRLVGEGAVTIVHEVPAGLEVGRDQQLRVAVAVHVDEGRLKAPDVVDRIAERGHGHVVKGPVAVIPIEPVALVVAPPGGDEEVEIAVEVVVAESGSVAGWIRPR